jgi:Protein of unknown function (DUF2796)
MRSVRPPLAVGLLACVSGPLFAAGAHVHGLVNVDVAVDGPVLVVQLDAPLDSLVGFEHRPRTAAQRQAADAAIARLKNAAALVRPDAAAKCVPSEARVLADALQPVPPGAPAPAAGEHADLQASYSFRCAAPEELKAVELALFEAFARIQRIEVQVAGAKGQTRVVLRRPAAKVVLTR